MALSKHQVTQCIVAVRHDGDAAGRISSIFSVMGRQAGFTRNALMATSNAIETLGRAVSRGTNAAFTLGTSELTNWNNKRTLAKYGYKGPYDQPLLFDPNVDGSLGAEYQCTAISEAAQKAIDKRQKLSPDFVPGLARVSCHSRSEGFAHMGVVLEMKDKKDYVLDWWATLDIDNPLVYKFDDFDMNRKDAALEFKNFGGFP